MQHESPPTIHSLPLPYSLHLQSYLISQFVFRRRDHLDILEINFRCIVNDGLGLQMLTISYVKTRTNCCDLKRENRYSLPLPPPHLISRNGLSMPIISILNSFDSLSLQCLRNDSSRLSLVIAGLLVSSSDKDEKGIIYPTPCLPYLSASISCPSTTMALNPKAAKRAAYTYQSMISP